LTAGGQGIDLRPRQTLSIRPQSPDDSGAYIFSRKRGTGTVNWLECTAGT